MSLYQLPKVQFRFAISGSPLNWEVKRFEIDEQLGHPYIITMDVVADKMANTNDLVGSCCTLEIIRAGRKRRFNGVVFEYMDQGYSITLHHSAHLKIGSPLAILKHGLNSKVFQNLTAPEIIEKVIQDGIKQFFPKTELGLLAKYAKRECCIQYRESDWDFIERLMAEEGLTLYTEADGNSEKIVITDMNQARTLVDSIDGRPIPVLDETTEAGARECISKFFGTRSLGPSIATVSANDWTRGPLTNTTQGESPIPREVYEHSPQAIVSAYQGKTYTVSHEIDRARAEKERGFTLQNVASGRSDVVTLGVGKYFLAEQQLIPLADKCFVVISAKHTGISPESIEINAQNQIAEEQEPYYNEFKCIPATVPFRPARREKRTIIPGVLTATVVGSPSEEIHTDEHGRIRIQFHWDREGPNNHMSTCWVRVAQSWAGNGFGTMFIPRIGMEVLVQFVNGDPDQPVVVGCVYNGKNRPPIRLPDNKSRSTIRTESSKGGSGYNELRFEDMTGGEEIYLHAQKDFNEIVENNHNTTVHVNQTKTVDGDQTETVHKNQTLTVDQNRTETVHQNQIVTVDKDQTVTINGNQNHTIQGNQNHTIHGSQNVVIHGSQNLVINGGGMAPQGGIDGHKVFVIGDHHIDSSKKLQIQAPDEISISITGGNSSIVIKPDGIKLKCGDSFIEIKSGQITLHTDNDDVKLNGDVTITTKGNANVGADKKTTIYGAGVDGAGKVSLFLNNQQAEIQFMDVNESIKLGVGGVSIKTNYKATIESKEEATIKGSQVKFNP